MHSNRFTKLRTFVRIATLMISAASFAVAAPAQPASSDIVAAYAKISDALASDDLGAAKSAATIVREKADAAGQHAIMEGAATVAAAGDISTAREAFKGLSVSIEPLAADQAGYTVMTCPMAHADWVQVTGTVKNPYLGKAMQSCGSPKKPDGAHQHASGCGSGCDM